MSYIKYPHGFKLSADYKTYREVADDVLNKSNGDTISNESGILSFFDDIFGKDEPTKLDTSIGGNDVVNPYPGGDPDDDVIFPLNSIDSKGLRGLGHKYLEAYQNTQKTMWISCGIPKFNSLEAFYDLQMKNTGDDADQYANVVTQGSDEQSSTFFGSMSSFGKFIGNAAKTAGKLAIRLPFLPVRSYNWLQGRALNDTITKYYDFEPAMVQYYKLVNSIIGVLAVSMNLYGSDDSKDFPKNYGKSFLGDAASEFVDLASDNDVTPSIEPVRESNAIPEVLKNGPDIYTILNKKRRYNKKEDPSSLDSITSKIKDKFFNWAAALGDSMGGADQFIGFRVEKSTDAYETISNTTAEPEIAGILNGFSEKMRSTQFSLMGMNLSDGLPSDGPFSSITNGISDAMNFIKDWISSATNSFNFGMSQTLFTGNGYFDIPEVWKNSSFTKSYSFSIELKSRLGDPVSIYQNIYIPLACLLAAACPRAVGKNMFTAPFILQAYVQGMFAIPVGIIDNITLKRGGSDYGWSFDSLPTSISVSFSIKDLSPAMFLSLYGEGFFNIFASNSSMHEYLATLSGLGLAERKRFGLRLKRRFESALLLHRTTTFNPMFWSNKWGNSKFLRMVGTVIADNKWPEQKQ